LLLWYKNFSRDPLSLKKYEYGDHIHVPGLFARLWRAWVIRPELLSLDIALPGFFILIALPVCLFLSVSVPTGEPPDEPAHIIRAASLLHGNFFGERQTWKDMEGNVIPGAGVVANPALLEASLNIFPNSHSIVDKKMSADLLLRLHSIKWAASPTFLYAPNTAVYMPLFYIPAALALGVSHELGVAPHAAILLGRIVNSLCFTAIGLLALMIARHGRGILFCVLTLPMTLSLAASFNQDGLLIAVSTLAAALLTRRALSGGAYWLSSALLACVIAAKIAYIPLAGMMLIPLCQERRLPNWRPAIKVSLITALPGILWTVFSLLYVASPFVRGPAYHPGPLWPGNPNTLFHTTDARSQLEVFLHNPLLIAELPAHDWRTDAILSRLRELIGVLGQLDVLLPHSLYWLWYVALVSALLASVVRMENSPQIPNIKAVAVGVGAIILSYIAIYDVQYLSWTLVGAADVDGVQGRYGLPLLAFLAPVIPRLFLVSNRSMFILVRGALMAPAAVAAGAGLVVLPQVIVLTYYLR